MSTPSPPPGHFGFARADFLVDLSRAAFPAAMYEGGYVTVVVALACVWS